MCYLKSSYSAISRAAIAGAMGISCFLLSVFTLLASEPDSTAHVTKAVEWRSLQVYPEQAVLDHIDDSQHIVAIATDTAGISHDVTNEIAIGERDKEYVRLEEGILFSEVPGKHEIQFEWSGLKSAVHLDVRDQVKARAVSFQLDIIPILTMAGCNSGSCHGASRGKDGFRMSLFGFDPDGDYFRITREQSVRRINLAVPEESLLYLKAVGQVPHSGGAKLSVDSEEAIRLKEWLAAGVPADQGVLPRCVSVELYPNELVLTGDEKPICFVAVANYDDGTSRDVTRLSTFASSNDQCFVMTKGVGKAKSAGESFVTARFDTHTVGSNMIVLADSDPLIESLPANNYIDELVNAKLQRLRLSPSPTCSDQVFVRRVMIDLVGRLPSTEEIEEFERDESSNKRAKLVDRLLDDPDFNKLWAMRWTQILMIRSNDNISRKSAGLYAEYVAEQFADRVPIDVMVRNLLTSSGSTFENPGAIFYQIERDTLKVSENVAQAFLGIRVQCAQCHNHPFDRWTMNDYYGFASFFAQVGRKQAEDYREFIVFDRGNGEVKHPVTNQPIPPTFLGAGEVKIQKESRRTVLADWLTSRDNRLFSEGMANRVWAVYMGQGLVDPVDDIRISNPPSNRALYEELGRRLVEYDFDLRRIVRDICTSSTYERDSLANDKNYHDTRNYAYSSVRRLPAEVLLDCIDQVTKVPTKLKAMGTEERAIELEDGSDASYFLTTFGTSPRTTVCACEASTDPSLSQALHLLNGDTVHTKVRSSPWFKETLNKNLSGLEVINEIYQRAFGRTVTEQELADYQAIRSKYEKEQEWLEDIFWGVLNSREFSFNH